MVVYYITTDVEINIRFGGLLWSLQAFLTLCFWLLFHFIDEDAAVGWGVLLILPPSEI